MKKIILLITFFAISGCAKNSQNDNLLINTGNQSSQSGNIESNVSMQTGKIDTDTGTQNLSGVSQDTGDKSNLNLSKNNIFLDKDALKILFNISGNVSNIQLVGNKIFFFDTKEGIIKYYEDKKLYTLDWTKQFGSQSNDGNGKKIIEIDNRFYNYKFSKDGNKIAWFETQYFSSTGLHNNLCYDDELIIYSISKLYISDTDGQNKKFIKVFNTKKINFPSYLEISFFDNNKVYIHINASISCGGAYEPCYNTNLQIFDINTKNIQKITDDNQCFAGVSPDGDIIAYSDGFYTWTGNTIILKNLLNNSSIYLKGLKGFNSYELAKFGNKYVRLSTSLNEETLAEDSAEEGSVFYNFTGRKIFETGNEFYGFLSDDIIYYKKLENNVPKYFLKNISTGTEKEIVF